MNKNANNLLNLYEQGLTSLEDEETLLKLYGNSKEEKFRLFNFIKHHKKQIPENLEAEIWLTLLKEKRKIRRKRIQMFSIAASVILIVFVVAINPFDQIRMNETEKLELLNEAYGMISESEEQPIVREVLYEDDILIIYYE